MGDDRMQNSGLARRALAVAAVALATAACGSSGGSTGSTVSNLFFFNSTTPPPLPGPDKSPDDIDCPRIDIFEGGAALRGFTSGQVGNSNEVRSQISIGQTARECTLAPGGGLTLKVGVEGRALVGPAGAPGTFTAPLTVFVKSGENVVARRTRTISVTVPPGDTQATFVAVEDGIAVPAGSANLSIEVGLGNPGGAPQPSQRRARR